MPHPWMRCWDVELWMRHEPWSTPCPWLVVFTKRLLYMNGILREDTLLYELSRNLCFFFVCAGAEGLVATPRPQEGQGWRAGLVLNVCTGKDRFFDVFCLMLSNWAFLDILGFCGVVDFLVTPQSRYHHHAKRDSQLNTIPVATFTSS